MKENMAPSMGEILETIKGTRNYVHATKMYELGRELGCEIDPRKEDYGYKIHFRLKHHGKDLYAMECGEDNIRVVANLQHVDEYKETLANCTKKVRACVENEFVKTEFALDNKMLDGFGRKEQTFQDMRTPDWADLVELIRREHRFAEK